MIRSACFSAFYGLAIFLCTPPSLARELAVGDGFTITSRGSSACAESVDITVEADKAAYFEDRLPALRKLLASAIPALRFNCDKLDTVEIDGRVTQTVVFLAETGVNSGWTLTVLPTPLEFLQQQLGKRAFRVEDILRAERAYSPLRSLDGFEDTAQHLFFMHFINMVAPPLVTEQGGAALKTYLASVRARDSSAAAVSAARAELERAFATLTPDLAPRAREIIDAEAAVIAEADWDAFLSLLLTEGVIYDNVLGAVSKKLSENPPPPKLAGQIDARVQAWLIEEIDLYDALLSEGYAADIREKQSLRDAIAQPTMPPALPLTTEAVRQAVMRLESAIPAALKILTSEADAIIADAGESYLDVPEVWETGVALSSEFSESGFESQAQRVTEQAEARVKALIAEGQVSLKSELTRAQMTRKDIAAFTAQAETFGALSEDFPDFAAYVGLIQDGIASGRQRFCAGQATEAAQHTALLEHRIETGAGPTTIRDFTCALYQNDHVLLRYAPGGWTSPALLAIERADVGIEEYELSASENSETLVGRKLRGNPPVRLDVDAWLALTDDLMTTPPSGVPDALGVTECDRLAADPTDPARTADGITLDTVPETFDFDRAIDACIAAVEHAPEQPRLRYQLARLLYAVGIGAEAAIQAQAAADAGYAPALFLRAQLHLLDDGDDAFYDAIDLLRAGSSKGYALATTMLNELVPLGSDFYRPLPPPTDAQILAAAGRNLCTPVIFGMQTCVVYTGVHSKNCFQTAASEFSCEIRMQARCEVHGGDQFFRGLTKMACTENTVTDPQFITIGNTNDNSWRLINRD